VGKASSSKKVQRAAKAAASSRGASESRELGFPLVIGLVVILGIAMVLVARTSRDPLSAPRINEDHWHAAYTIYDCGNEVANLTSGADPDGIHSHNDGLIHIHPFNSSSSGADAQLGVFLEAMRATVTRDAIVTPESGTIAAADGCDGEPAVIKVARYQVDPDVSLSAVWDDNFDSIQFLNDREAFVIAKVPVGEDPPPPSDRSLAQLDESTGSQQISTDTVPLDTVPLETVPLDTTPSDSSGG